MLICPTEAKAKPSPVHHPNFDQPSADLGNVGQLGLITNTVNPPTSIYGSFLGADASPRAIQLRANLNF